MRKQPPTPPCSSRRRLLSQAGGGFGAIALASLLHNDGFTQPARAAGQTEGQSKPNARNPLASKPTHFAPRAKRVIWLFMHGGPSHMDLFDYKPDLVRYAGKPVPESFGKVMTRRNVAKNTLMGPVKPFKQRGQSGLWVSDFLPHIAQCADDLCVIKSCHGDSVNHPQSVYQMNTGSILMGRPSVGAWVAYGLGSENQNMPAFVVLPDPDPGGVKGGPPAWGSGYLPATYQGTLMRPGANPILNLKPQPKISGEQQKHALDLLRKLNADHLLQRDNDDELSARIASYELAFRMQSAAPRSEERRVGKECRSRWSPYH